MAFTQRFGGWRPVQLEHGVGVLRLDPDRAIEPVGYRFEVWHQVVDGFAGPYRSEGTLSLPGTAAADVAGRSATLVLEDGRRLDLRLTAEGALLAHGRPVRPADPPA
jgi:hypothetical protein